MSLLSSVASKFIALGWASLALGQLWSMHNEWKMSKFYERQFLDSLEELKKAENPKPQHFSQVRKDLHMATSFVYSRADLDDKYVDVVKECMKKVHNTNM